MKQFLMWSMLAGAVLAIGGAVASEGSLNGFKPKVMPVLVRADANGNVTSVEPSRQLPPRFQRLLEQSIGSWISEPARIKGKPVDSYVVINVVLRAEQQGDGNYTAGFDYVSSNPVMRRGPLHWQSNGVNVALVDEFDRQRMRPDRMLRERHLPERFERPVPDRPQPSQPAGDGGRGAMMAGSSNQR